MLEEENLFAAMVQDSTEVDITEDRSKLQIIKCSLPITSNYMLSGTSESLQSQPVELVPSPGQETQVPKLQQLVTGNGRTFFLLFQNS